jgi:membrane protease YdiL (CAAX protease family)
MIHSKQETSETTGPGHAGGLTGADWVAALPPLAVALGYLLAITLAELLTTFTSPRTGLALHSMILALLLLHAALTWDRPIHTVLITLVFAPLIRLVSLSLPLFPFPLFTWYGIISLPLFVTAALTGRLLGLRWQALGVNLHGLRWQLPIALTGLALGYLEYQILQPQALVPSFTWQAIWLPALILLISTGFFEELVFRSLMQTTAIRVFGRFGLLFVALVFAALHIGYKSLLDIAFVFAVGLFFGWAVARTRSIVGVTLSHGLTNIVLFLVMPFVALAPSAGLTAQPAGGSPVAVAATSTVQPAPAALPATAAALLPAATPSPSAQPAIASLTPTPGPTSAPASATPSPTPSPTPTAAQPWAVVKDDLLNVRTGPSTQYGILRLAQPGQRYPIARRNSTGDWLLIRFTDGLAGWVSSEYVTVEGDITSVPVEGA